MSFKTEYILYIKFLTLGKMRKFLNHAKGTALEPYIDSYGQRRVVLSFEDYKQYKRMKETLLSLPTVKKKLKTKEITINEFDE